MRPAEFERRLAAALREAARLRRNDALVLAVSGGADSMALLTALHEFNRRRACGWRLVVAHLDHGLRGKAAADDADFVAAEAARRGLACVRETADLGAGDRRTREEAARHARYRFLQRIAGELGATAVVTAHQADDQAETVLHQIIRGSGLRGLAGMAAARPIAPRSDILLVRPLLDLTRAEVRHYLRARRQTWRDDETNAETDRARNRIRHRVLPMLAAELNPQVGPALRRLAKQAGWLRAFLADAAMSSLSELTRARSMQCVDLDAAGLMRLPAILRTHVVLTALIELGASEQRLTFERLCAAAELGVAAPRRRQVQLPGGWRATRQRSLLRLEKHAASPAHATIRSRRVKEPA